MMFTENRAFNAAGKTVTKIGIYALPPQKRSFYSDFIEISILNHFLA
jgi:regulation of enolase protein 1 (concanavalin A-like superfamily)